MGKNNFSCTKEPPDSERSGLLSAVQVTDAAAASISIKKETKPMTLRLKVAVVFTIAMSGGSVYFAYHAPGSVGSYMKQKYGFSDVMIGWMLTAYSLPNLFVPVFSGSFIDEYGVAVVSIVCNILCTSGCIVFALSDGDTILMLLGRMLLGIGGASTVMCCQAMCTLWFKGHGDWLGFSLALCMALQQGLGSALCFVVLPPIAQQDLDLAWWFVVLVCMVPTMASLVYLYLHKSLRSYDDDDEVQQLSRLAQATDSMTKNVEQEHKTETDQAEVGDSAIAKWTKDMRTYPGEFWYLVVSVFFLLSIEYTFVNYAGLLIQENYPGYDSQKAALTTSLVYFMCLSAPVFGYILDQVGMRIYAQIMSLLVILVGLLCLTLHVGSPLVLMTMMGLMFAVAETNVFTMTYIVVPHMSLVGKATGLITVSLSFGLMLTPLLVGYLRELEGNYTASMCAFIVYGLIALACSIKVLLLDRASAKLLSA